MEEKAMNSLKGQFAYAIPGPSGPSNFNIKCEMFESYEDTFLDGGSHLNTNERMIQNIKKEKFEAARIENDLSERYTGVPSSYSIASTHTEQHSENCSEIQRNVPVQLKMEPRCFDNPYQHLPMPILNVKQPPRDLSEPLSESLSESVNETLSEPLSESLSELDEVSDETMQVFAEEISMSDFLSIGESSQIIEGVVQAENICDAPPILSHIPENDGVSHPGSSAVLESTHNKMFCEPFQNHQIFSEPFQNHQIPSKAFQSHQMYQEPFQNHEISPGDFQRQQISPDPLQTDEISPEPFHSHHISPEPFQRYHISPEPYQDLQITPEPLNSHQKWRSSLGVKKKEIKFKTYPCYNCGKHFSSIEQHEEHIKTHSAPKVSSMNLKCVLCGKCFMRQSGLSSHLRYLHNIKAAPQRKRKKKEMIWKPPSTKALPKVPDEEVNLRITKILPDAMIPEAILNHNDYSGHNFVWNTDSQKHLKEEKCKLTQNKDKEIPEELQLTRNEDKQTEKEQLKQNKEHETKERRVEVKKEILQKFDQQMESDQRRTSIVEPENILKVGSTIKELKQEHAPITEIKQEIPNDLRVFDNSEIPAEEAKGSVSTEHEADEGLALRVTRGGCYLYQTGKEVDAMANLNYRKFYHKNYSKERINYEQFFDIDGDEEKAGNSETYKCPSCNFYGTATRLKIHESIHPDSKLYKCKICSFRGPRSVLESHKLEHKNGKIHNCRYCSFQSSTKSGIELHELKHDEYTKKKEKKNLYRVTENTYRKRYGDRKFSCSRCNYQTDLEHRFSLHKLSHFQTNSLRQKVMRQMIKAKTQRYR